MDTTVENKGLTRMEAIAEMAKGKKVKHRFFSDHEWVKMNGFDFEFENGVICKAPDMWRDRVGGYWETGWSVIEDTAPLDAPVQPENNFKAGSEGFSEGELLANNSKPEYVICAAVWFKDGKKHVHQPKNIEDGFVVSGRRHHNCYYIASICLADGYSEVKGTCVQGFLTSKDIFIDRKQAGELAFKSRQIKELTDCLFSEDLY